MSNIKVTKKEIDHLLNSGNVKVQTMFGKCTVVTMQLESGFVLTESSGCVDPENYDPELGKRLCYEHIEKRLWELEGYALQKKVYEEERKKNWPKPIECKEGGFGWAIECLKRGSRLRRRGWNGKNQYIELAEGIGYRNAAGDVINCEHTAIGNKAIAFCGTSGVQMGWLASQADMLAEDWELAD